MIKVEDFYNQLNSLGINFFTGVPDSLLKDICSYVTDNTSKERNVIAANEGGAIALATGYNLATGSIPMVYMQNSGIGNAVNPLMSLADQDVYSIPLLMMVGWRGEPGLKDEPQHIKQGKVTIALLDAMQIPYEVLSTEFDEVKKQLEKAVSYINVNNAPFALVVRKNTFDAYKLKNIEQTNFELTREQAVKEVTSRLSLNDIVVSTTGMTSRELFEYRTSKKEGHQRDFLTVGSMGHASQIALGIALEKPNRNVYCFDGDGALLMHTGSMGIIGDLAPTNFKHIVFNNGAHDSVGGQPTISFSVNFGDIAKGFNYVNTYKVSALEELNAKFELFQKQNGPSLFEICVNKGARKDLGRPTISPVENKVNFMEFLKEK